MKEEIIITRREASQRLHIGLNVLDAQIRREYDPLPTIRVGRRVLIPVDMLKEWVNRQVKTA